MEEIENSSVGILKPPRRNGKILPNFDFILPKFHFILPKFYLPSLWRIFVCSLEIPDFLGRRDTSVGSGNGRTTVRFDSGYLVSFAKLRRSTSPQFLQFFISLRNTID